MKRIRRRAHYDSATDRWTIPLVMTGFYFDTLKQGWVGVVRLKRFSGEWTLEIEELRRSILQDES